MTTPDPALKIHRGLKDVYFERSATTFIDGKAGELRYRGYSIHDLAKNSTFEETTYLLLHGELPTQAQLESCRAELTAPARCRPRCSTSSRHQDRAPHGRAAHGGVGAGRVRSRDRRYVAPRHAAQGRPAGIAGAHDRGGAPRIRDRKAPWRPTRTCLMRPTSCGCSRARSRHRRRPD